MKEFKFLALCFIAALFAGVQSGSGQAISASVQNVSSRPAPGRAAPRTAPRPANVVPRVVSSYAPRTVVQSAPNLLPNYPVVPGSSNPTVTATNAQRIPRINGQEPITLDPATRQRELRTLAAMRERRNFGAQNRTLAAINPQRPVLTRDPAVRQQSETRDSSTELTRTKW